MTLQGGGEMKSNKDNIVVNILKSDMAYESRPWFCLLVGLYAVTQVQKSFVMLVSGLMLLACAHFILSWRNSHRQKPSHVRK